MDALQGKAIIVAGGGGIGGGLARRYCQEGASVLLGDICLGSAEATARELRGEGGRIVAVHLDGGEESSVADAVRSAIGEFGRLDGLHANFATVVDEPGERGILELPLELYDQTMGVNARGYYLCTRAVLPALIERGGGSIVYTSSIAAHTGGAGQVAYAMSKAAGHALMRHVASRYGSAGIRANSIAPGMTLHARLEAELDEAFLESMRAMAPLRSRFGRPDDIAALGTLLMSEEGSYITGQVICVDGGMTMRA